MSEKAKRTFALWFLFILCLAPVAVLTPHMLEGKLALSRLTALYYAFLIASAAFLIAAVLSSVRRKTPKAPPRPARPSFDPERKK